MEILILILTVLKWIGMILLSLLGLIVFLLLLILLWPISYQAEGAYNGKITLSAKVCWFLGLLKINVSYLDGLDWKISVFGITVLPKKKEEVPPHNSREPSADNADVSVCGQPKADMPQEARKPPKDAVFGSDQKQKKLHQTLQPSDTSADEQDTVSKISLQKTSLINKWKLKLQLLFERINRIKKNLDHYLNILKRKETQHLLIHTLQMLGKMLMHIRPRKFCVIAHIGMKDPSVTGQIMSIQGLLYPWLAERIIIFPYFEEERMEGNFYIAGHTILGVLLWYSIKIVANRDFLILLRILRKKEEV